MNRNEFAKMMDHTFLKAYATDEDLKKLCLEAKEYGFMMVAVNSANVRTCKEYLQGTEVHVGAAVGFPLGQTTIETKVFETRKAIEDGADEIDYVLNIGQLKMGNLDYIENEMSQITDICKENHVLSKVIFENCYLTKEEIIAAAKIAKRVRPDFIKTSTGFGDGGARAEDVSLMKETVGNEVKVKAAGGIRDLDSCLRMIEAGAERIGTSASVSLVNEFVMRGL